MKKMFLFCLNILVVCGLSADYMQQVDSQKGTFALEPLPYSYDALEPYIDVKTMHVHHDGHHLAYVNHLNAAIKGTKWQGYTLYELIAKAGEIPASIWHNAGGHWNHSFFWSILRSPKNNPGMSPKMRAEIEKYFGSVDAFKAQFRKAGVDCFGSGWVWLIRAKDGKLAIHSLPNQDNPLMDTAEIKGTPLLSCDVWEHAYYLKYLNKRDDFLDAFWNLVNWQRVEQLAF